MLISSQSGRVWALRAVIALVFVARASVSDACLWTYGTDHHGHRTEVGDDADHYVHQLSERKHDREHWEGERDRLAIRVSEEGDHEDKNDLAVAFIHLGEYDQALKLLNQIEKEEPGIYGTAANLGTLYELRGDNAQALHWIKEGIVRNKESHFGSEWLHVKILEAKIALAKDPKWLEKNTVLGLDFGSEAVPSRPSIKLVGNDGKPLTLEDVRRAIQYQLEERLQFVEPPEPIVGDLLVDLGNANALEVAVEFAIPVYAMAIGYGSPRQELAQLRKEHFEKMAAANPHSGKRAGVFPDFFPIAIAWGAGIFAVAMGLWLWRRARRARLEKEALEWSP